MQANFAGLRDRKKNMEQEDRPEAWEGPDKTMREAATEDLCRSMDRSMDMTAATLAATCGKFVDGKYGSLELFDQGLEGYVGLPDVNVFEAMMREHASTENDKEEWERIVAQGTDGRWLVNNLDRAGNVMCPDFMQHEMTKQAKLTIEEVVALRLYTGPAFHKYNSHLRFGLSIATTEDARAKKERHYVTTIHAIASALKKVSRFTELPEGGKVYRGMSGVKLPEEFEKPDKYGCRGGVELGFMSTSTDKKQALAYMDMSNCMPTLFEIQLGQVDRGATLQWISQFPEEAEVLLPPLSNLEVVGKPELMMIEAVDTRVEGLTIDELQQRRKTLHVSMCDNLMSEAELAAMAKAGSAGDARWDELKKAVEEAVEEGRILMQNQERRSVEEFNDDSKYSKMLQDAVQVKVMVARKTDALIKSGGEGGERMMLRGVTLDAFSTVYSSCAARAGYAGAKWERLTTPADEDEVMSLRGDKGRTVMHWAVQDDSRAKLALALLEAGADKDAKDKNGYTPLHLGAEKGREAVAQALLAAGADKKATNKHGATPLHLAAANGREAVARVLLAVGADKKAKNDSGETSLHLAQQKGHAALVALLS
ncbi:hypothetical protein T484DRAFT_1799601 [Baffinella frigidus]|nr:hypothetical protein T484DRAFT_1799601 [Cryptophyta sp. CCMP2293]